MSSLREYQKKRRFRKTPEPQGASSSSSSPPIFVVQEHWASRHHFDFRLEAFGTLKSWAVPKGIPLQPGEKRLAVEVEDHPLEYAQFQGSIPKGEYGAGTVKIWDRGVWQPPSDLAKVFQKGHVDFELKGKKLKGPWLLRRMKSKADDKKNQWLLIKRHSRRKNPTQIKKKRKADPWPKNLTPQLPVLVEKVPSGSNWIHEIKLDGYRTITTLKNNKAKMLTRNGLDWTEKYRSIAAAVKNFQNKSLILDGEIIAFDENHHSSFLELQKALKKKDQDALFYCVFDLLYFDGNDLREKPLETRKVLLKKTLSTCKTPKLLYSDHVRAQGDEMLEKACGMGLEGVVSKDFHSTYVHGRTALWQKTKCLRRQEFVIGGYTTAKNARPGFSAVLVGAHTDEGFRYMGRVGTGFDDVIREDLFKKLRNLETKKSPFTVAGPSAQPNIKWVQPKLVAEVEFNSWTSDRRLRQPSFQGLREDKSPKKIQIDNPKRVGSVASQNLRDESNVHITHPDRLIYPRHNITKLDVANYYKSISAWMLPHLQYRLLALVRCPDESGKGCFYQKRIDNSKLDEVNTAFVKNQESMFIVNIKGLLQLVQWGALEFHAWQARAGHELNPDQLVFDLDPDKKVKWEKVIQTALRLRDLLQDLGLRSFVKTTGGKGLHIHVPIQTLYSWKQIKSFAKAVATQLESQNPQLYTINMSLKKRSGKIFLDYLRNGFGATAIAPYSLRARPDPTVAMPLSWHELKNIKCATEFTMNSVLEKLALSGREPWPQYFTLKQRIRLFDHEISPA